jgi:D-psicose/D-tagatose/L-ribulose 3-epimerase
VEQNKIGIYFAYWTSDWRADFVYYIEKAAKLGFDILEISTAYLDELPKTEIDKIRKAAEDHQIEITYCIGFPASEDSAIRKSGIEHAKKTLEIINYLGGKNFCGINYSSWPGSLNEGITDKRPYLNRSMNSIREVIKTAEDLDITYCVEIVNRYEQYLLNTAAEGVAYVDEIGSSKLKVLLDTFHMNIEEENIGNAIITAGERLGHLHIGETNRNVPGKGRMPWDEIMSALKRINYTNRIVMEPFVKMGGQVARDIKIWRDISDHADETQLDANAKGGLEFIRSKIRK